MAFLEKTTCGCRALTVEPPSPAAQRCTDGAPNGQKRKRRRNEAEEKPEVKEAGRAKKLGRIQSFLSLRSLKLIVTEEICGRFGSFRWINVCISRW